MSELKASEFGRFGLTEDGLDIEDTVSFKNEGNGLARIDVIESRCDKEDVNSGGLQG